MDTKSKSANNEIKQQLELILSYWTIVCVFLIIPILVP
jgi:hypothetical protein